MGCYLSRAVGGKAASKRTRRVEVPVVPRFHTIKNPRLLSLAEEYLENAAATAALLDALELRLSKARAGHALFLDAVRCHDRGEEECCLKKLKEFTETAAAATAADAEFDGVCERHRSMYREVGLAMGEIEAKLRSTERWRKACTAFVLASAALSAVAGLPPVAVVMAASAFRVVNAWAQSIWSCRLRALAGDMDVVATMWKGRFGVHEMESARAIAEGMEICIGSVRAAAEFAVGEEGNVAVGFAVEEMRKKIGSVEEKMEGLEMKLDSWLQEMERTVTEFLTVTITVKEI